MKKPRMITIGESEEISWEDYEDYSSHAQASAIYYTTNFMKTSNQLRDKLYAKGYPKDEVAVKGKDGQVIFVNMVEDVVTFLEDNLLIDDRAYAESLTQSLLGRNMGRNRAKQSLWTKGIPPDLAAEVIEKIYGDNDEAHSELRDLMDTLLKQESARSGTLWDHKRRITQRAVSKGWSFGEVNQVLESIDFEEFFGEG